MNFWIITVTLTYYHRLLLRYNYLGVIIYNKNSLIYKKLKYLSDYFYA